jgi:hypothetical protein
MTDPRAAFEAWFTKDGDYEPEWLDGRETSAGFLYSSADTENMWEAYQAAINHERSECAKVAETVPLESFCSVPSMAMLAKNRADVAAAIRARSQS